MPVVGFNSGKYDMNLIKEYFVKRVSFDEENDVFTAKKDNGYMLITTSRFKFLDVKNHIEPGLSYDVWCRSMGCKLHKLVFPYEWLDSYEKLNLPCHQRVYSLLKMLELWKEALNKGKSVGAIFMDLSKAFDTLNHDLLIAKLEAYGFSENSLNYIQSYLRNRLQRTNVNNNFSLWKDILSGVRQGSILGPLMFNIYINDIFLFPDNGCLSNYADDTTLYSVGENHNTNRNILIKSFLSLQKWFYDNYMVLNQGKCCYMSFGSNPDKSDLILEDSTKIPSAEEYAILGVAIDNRLTFNNHLKNLCKKIANKLNALTRIAPYLDHNQLRLIYNSFFKGQLSYCPLIWTFYSRRSDHLINKLQERALRIAYSDFNSSFSELLKMANESTIHIRNLKFLLTEVYKFLNGLSPPPPPNNERSVSNKS